MLYVTCQFAIQSIEYWNHAPISCCMYVVCVGLCMFYLSCCVCCLYHVACVCRPVHWMLDLYYKGIMLCICWMYCVVYCSYLGMDIWKVLVHHIFVRQRWGFFLKNFISFSLFSVTKGKPLSSVQMLGGWDLKGIFSHFEVSVETNQ